MMVKERKMMVRERLDPEMRKEDIQKAAMALFSSKGFNNTTMDDVREKSGLSAGGLYYYYKNTAEILYDIMDRGSRMREATVTNTVQHMGNKLTPHILAEVVVDKMLANNPFTPIYVIFLGEIKKNEQLNALYEKLKRDSITYFKHFMNGYDCGLLTDDDYEFVTNLINASLLSCEILDTRENFLKNRQHLVSMIEGYFTRSTSQ